MLVLSIIESVYLFYMFHMCETSIDFGLTPTPTGYWLEHVVGNEKALRICPFGRIAILFLIAILLGRNATTAITPTYIHISLGIAFILSFLNTNALIYLLPIFILEGLTPKNESHLKLI